MLATIVGSTISRNSSVTGGGIVSTTQLGIGNSTLSGNGGVEVGGISVSTGTATLNHVTLANNQGAGLQTFSGGSIRLSNTIVASNSGQNCIQNPAPANVQSNGHNLDSDASCGLTDASDLAGIDPFLGPLAANGGPTLTHALLMGSLAIDAGDPMSSVMSDQRGFPRIGVADIGAFESQSLDLDGFDDDVEGGTDCDDSDASVFPGATEIADDGIDQDCNGMDLTTPAEEVVAETQFWLKPVVEPGVEMGYDTMVFPGLDDTPIEDLANARGASLIAIFRFNAETQEFEVYFPDAPAVVNDITVVNHGDALTVAIEADVELHFSWIDTTEEGANSATLLPGWTLVGFTGEDDTSLAELLAPLPETITSAFIFDPLSQDWLGFGRFVPEFVSDVTTVDRLDSVFVLNEGLVNVSITWFTDTWNRRRFRVSVTSSRGKTPRRGGWTVHGRYAACRSSVTPLPPPLRPCTPPRPPVGAWGGRGPRQ